MYKQVLVECFMTIRMASIELQNFFLIAYKKCETKSWIFFLGGGGDEKKQNSINWKSKC